MLETTDPANKAHPAAALLRSGDVRRFGPDGVLYEILHVDSNAALIRVIDTGEELSYPISKIIADPTD